MNYQLFEGDCLEVMAGIPDESVSAIVTDPPYGLSFMGKNWDHGLPGVPFWEQALRVAKPGAFLLAFGGDRTHHRLMVAIEDAGWEIRTCIYWVFGSGFPKSLNISAAIDAKLGEKRDNFGTHRPENRKVYGKNAGALRCSNCGNSRNGTSCNCPITAPATDAARLFNGYGTALKPAAEIIVVAMKPIDGTFADNALKHGLAGLNIDGCRIPISDGATMARNNKNDSLFNSHGGPNNAALHGEPNGRWPANLIHDGSEEVMAAFPVTTTKPGSAVRHNKANPYGSERTWSASSTPAQQSVGYTDTGSAARYFYCAKSSSSERSAGVNGDAQQRDDSRNALQPSMNDGEGNPFNRGAKPVINHHPTVKPISLMSYLCRLVKPPIQPYQTEFGILPVILDPFMGSGSTGVAALLEGVDFIGIEREAEYIDIARQRLEHYEDERSTEPIKLQGKAADFADLPMFQ